MLSPVVVNSGKYQDGVKKAFDDVRAFGLSEARARFYSSRAAGYKAENLDECHFDKGYCDGLVKCLWNPVVVNDSRLLVANG